MLNHADVWRAVDRLAQENEMSVSGLARRAGLDPTTFNKSKRITREGKHRWPSTESIAKILTATGASINEYVSYIGEDSIAGVYRNIPLIGLTQAGSQGYFDNAGYPASGSWDEIPFPGFSDPHAYAIEIIGESLEPVFRDGDTVIVSPEANIRRGDRVIVKTRKGPIIAKTLQRQSAKRIDLQSLNPIHEDSSFAVEDVDWMARIIWASQ